jgi:hypothetical protein
MAFYVIEGGFPSRTLGSISGAGVGPASTCPKKIPDTYISGIFFPTFKD